MPRPLALTALLLLSAATSAQPLVPREIPFQGVLQDSGTPVTAATDVTFRLFEAASGGSAVWTDTQTVTPDADGAFAVRLGATTDLPDDMGRPLWLEVSVPSGGGTQVLGPRTALGAAPYALGLYGLTVTPSTFPSDGRGPNLVGGSPANAVSPNVSSATISGGGTLDFPNTVTAEFGTIGGGVTNTASGIGSTVGGGNNNTARGFQSTVPGGLSNQAHGSFSFAAGYYARAAHDGTFVWSDNSQFSADSLVSTGRSQFLIRAAGGVGIGTNGPLAEVHIQGEDRSLQTSALENDEVVVEAEDAALGLYSSAGGTWGSALALAEVTASGDIASKWGIARRTGASGGLYFTFGPDKNYASNDAQMRIDTDGSVHADDAFVGGGADFAEFFPLAASESAASVRPGDLVGLRGGQVGLATEAAEQVMIASSDPAFVGNPDAEADGALVALVGQAEVRITGAASVGDLLVASGLDDGTARAVAPEAYRPEADGPVAGRVLALPEAGRAVALVGVDEAAALRAVVEAQAVALGEQAARLDAQQAQIDLLVRRLDTLTATASVE